MKRVLTAKQVANYQQRSLRSISKRLYAMAYAWEGSDYLSKGVLCDLARKAEEAAEYVVEAASYEEL